MFYPLPEEKLKNRYKKVFEALKKNQSASLIYLPGSLQSGFFRFIVDSNQELLSKFIDTNKYHFIQIEPLFDNKEDQILYIAMQFLNLPDHIFPDKDILRKEISRHDHKFCLVIIQNTLKNLPSNKKIVFVLYRFQESINIPGYQSILKNILCTHHEKLYSPSMFIFIGYNSIFSQEDNCKLDQVLNENKFYDPLLNEEEIEFTKHRLEKKLNIKVSEKTHSDYLKFSGGMYLLYKLLVTSNAKAKDLNNIHYEDMPQNIQELVKELRRELILLGDDKKEVLLKYFPNQLPEIFKIVTESNSRLNNYEVNTKYREFINQLTAQESMAFKLLLRNINNLVDRDTLAKEIWGNDWYDKYSDWAIDKLISKIRKQLKTSNTLVRISTLRHRGFILESN